MLEGQTRFRKVEGYGGLAGLAVRIERDLLHNRQLDSDRCLAASTPGPSLGDNSVTPIGGATRADCRGGDRPPPDGSESSGEALR